MQEKGSKKFYSIEVIDSDGEVREISDVTGAVDVFNIVNENLNKMMDKLEAVSIKFNQVNEDYTDEYGIDADGVFLITEDADEIDEADYKEMNKLVRSLKSIGFEAGETTDGESVFVSPKSIYTQIDEETATSRL